LVDLSISTPRCVGFFALYRDIVALAFNCHSLCSSRNRHKILHSRGVIIATIRQAYSRTRGISFNGDIDDAIDLNPADTPRHYGYAQAGRYNRDGRYDLRHFRTELWAEPRAAASRND
jgi:hypothetical protein